MQFHQDRTQDRRIRAFESAKNRHCQMSIYGPCIVDRFGQVRTSLNKSEQLWSTILPQPWVTRCPNLAHPQICVQFPNRTSLKTLRPSEVVDSTICHTSVGVRCERVWNATCLHRTTTSERSLERSRLAELKYAFFRQDGPQILPTPKTRHRVFDRTLVETL